MHLLVLIAGLGRLVLAGQGRYLSDAKEVHSVPVCEATQGLQNFSVRGRSRRYSLNEPVSTRELIGVDVARCVVVRNEEVHNYSEREVREAHTERIAQDAALRVRPHAASAEACNNVEVLCGGRDDSRLLSPAAAAQDVSQSRQGHRRDHPLPLHVDHLHLQSHLPANLPPVLLDALGTFLVDLRLHVYAPEQAYDLGMLLYIGLSLRPM